MITGLFLEHELGKGKNEMPQYCCRKGDPFQGPKLGSCLLLLSHFSRVRLYAMAAHQAPPPLGFFRQEYWSGLSFHPPRHESEVAQSCPTSSDSMDCSLPGSSVRGILQARVLEWGALAFSRALV